MLRRKALLQFLVASWKNINCERTNLKVGYSSIQFKRTVEISAYLGLHRGWKNSGVYVAPECFRSH